MRKGNVLALMAIAWWAAFCTASRPYHLEQPVEVVYNPTSLAYIELDEYGDLWANKGEQLAAAVKLIETANQNPEGTIVVTYVHGWAHNADPGRPDDPDPPKTNLALFKNVLGHLTAEENEMAKKDNRPPRSIAGVFIAWRGRQLWPIDFYQRDSAATRVAGSMATEALVAINRIAKSREKDPERTKLVVVAHSLGALIVERAIIPAFDAWIVGQYKKSIEAPPPPDLVVLINAASTAIEAKKFVSTLNHWNLDLRHLNKRYLETAKPYYTHEVWPVPLMVAVTSEGDWATRNVLRYASIPRTLTKKHRSYEAVDKYGKVQPEPYTQRGLATHSAGNYSPLFSHRVRHMKIASAPDVRPCPADWIKQWDKGWGRRSAKPPSEALCFEVGDDRFWFVREPGAWNGSQYWIAPMPVTIVEEHSRIFTLPMVRLITGLVHVSGVMTPESVTTRQLESAVASGRVMNIRSQDVYTADAPSVCYAPPEVRVEYRGTQSPCRSGTPCWPNEPIAFSLVDVETGLAYEPQPCDDIVWDFGREIGSLPGVEVTPAGDVTAFSVTLRNNSGVKTVSDSIDRGQQPPPIDLNVMYRGRESNCMPDQPCWPGEEIVFEATVPSATAPDVTWSGSGVVANPDQPNVRSFDPGAHQVTATAVVSGVGRAERAVDIRVEPRPCPSLDTVALSYSGAGCSAGACRAGEPIEFFLNLPPGVPSTCFDVEWRAGEALVEDGAKLTHVFRRAGRQEVVARVTANQSSRELSAAVDVTCPAPPPIRLAFRGESGCTRETVCDGSLLCRLGERIVFAIENGPLAGCETVRWNFGDGSTDDRIAAAHTYRHGASAVATVEVGDDGAKRIDSAPIRFVVPPTSDDCPPLVPIKLVYRGEGCSSSKPKAECKPGFPVELAIDPASYQPSVCDSVVWVFGDGSAAAAGSTVLHVFAPGRHTVSVVVTRGAQSWAASSLVCVGCARHRDKCEVPRKRMKKASLEPMAVASTF